MKKLYTAFAFTLLSIGAFAQCNITSGPTITTNGLTITATGTGTGANFPQYGYDWGDQTSPGTTQTSTHTYASPGTYTVCLAYLDLADPQNCYDTSCTSVTVSAVGINDPSVYVLNMQVSPNPFSSQLSINLTMANAEMAEVAVYDITGKQVAVLKNGMMAVGSNLIEWKPAGLSAGVYFVQVKTNTAVITKKIVYTQN